MQRITAEEKAAARMGQADRRVPLDVVGVPAAMAPSERSAIEPPIRRPPGSETATGSWTAPTTAELKQHATESPTGNGRGSRRRCVPWRAKIQTATSSASRTA